MPPRQRTTATEPVPQVVASKLAELQARGIVAPLSTAASDRNSTTILRPAAKAIGVVIPAYLSIEELCVKSGINALREVALPLVPIPLPSKMQVAMVAAQHELTADTNIGGATSNGDAAVAPPADSALPAKLQPRHEASKHGGDRVTAPRTADPATVAAAAEAAVAAIMGLKRDVPRMQGADPQSAGGTAAPQMPPRAPPPGFSTAPSPSGAAGLPQQAKAGPPTSVRSAGGAITAFAPEGRPGAPADPQAPRPSSVPMRPPPTLGAVAVPSSSNGGGAQLPPPTPPNPPPQVPAGASNTPPPAPASSTVAASQARYSVPPLVDVSQQKAASQTRHAHSLPGATAPQSFPPARAAQPTEHQSLGGIMPPPFYMTTQQELPSYPSGPYAWQYNQYNPYAMQASQLYQAQIHQSAWFPQPQYPSYDLQQGEVGHLRQSAQVQQGPQAPPPQQPAGPPRPALLPPSLAPVSLMFGPPRGHAILAALRRALIAAFTRQPELFRSIFGFDLQWWSRTRGKPLGEDDLLTVIPWSDYATVLVRGDPGAAPALSGPSRPGRRRRRLLLNQVLSGLLGRRVYGNALLLRLRLEFGAGDSAVGPVVGSISGGSTADVPGSGECDHLLCAPLNAVGLRELMLRAETLAWHVGHCSAALKGMNLTPEAQVGWLARLPRTPLDERGDPDVAAALQLAADAAGLPPLPPARAAALVAAAGAAANEDDDNDTTDSESEEDSIGEETSDRGGRTQAKRPGRGGGKEGEANAPAGAAGSLAGVDGGGAGAVPAALAPLLRCVRCSSPWCNPAAASGRRAGGGRRSCPFGHVWRSLDLDTSGTAPTPILNAARPAVLGPASLTSSLSTTTHGSGGLGSGAAAGRALQPSACASLVAYLGDPSLWSPGLMELVAAAVEGSVDEAAAALAAEAATEALTGLAVGQANAEDSRQSPQTAAVASSEEGGECEDGGREGSRLADTEAKVAVGVTEQSSSERRELDEADAAREAMYAAAAAAVQPNRWPYYLSYCQMGAQCPNCHSCHELQLAAVAQRLRNRTRPSSARTSLAPGSAAAAAAEDGSRPGFRALAELDGDPYDIELQIAELQAKALRRKQQASRKAAARLPNGAAAAGGAEPAEGAAAVHTARVNAAPQPEVGAVVAIVAGAAPAGGHVAAVEAAAASTAPVAAAAEKLNWADDAEDAEKEQAAAAAAAAAAAVAAVAAAALRPAASRVPPAAAAALALQHTTLIKPASQQRMQRPPPPPYPPPPPQHPPPPPQHPQPECAARSRPRAPLFCMAAPAPAAHSTPTAHGGAPVSSAHGSHPAQRGGEGARCDARPLPELPDHLDDEFMLITGTAAPAPNGSAEAPASAADTDAGSDAAVAVATTVGACIPDRAAVAASLVAKSRNGVYVPPHLRSAAESAEAQAEAKAEAAGGAAAASNAAAETAEVVATAPAAGDGLLAEGLQLGGSQADVQANTVGQDGTREQAKGGDSRAPEAASQAASQTAPPHYPLQGAAVPIPVPVPVPLAPSPPAAAVVQQQQDGAQQSLAQSQGPQQQLPSFLQPVPSQTPYSGLGMHNQQTGPRMPAPQQQGTPVQGLAVTAGSGARGQDNADDEDVGDLLSLLVPSAAATAAGQLASHLETLAGPSTTVQHPPSGMYGSMTPMSSAPVAPASAMAAAAAVPASGIWSLPLLPTNQGSHLQVPVPHPALPYQQNEVTWPGLPYPQPLSGQFPLHSFGVPQPPPPPQQQQAHGFPFGPWGMGYGEGTAPSNSFGAAALPGLQQPQLLQPYSYTAGPLNYSMGLHGL